MICLLDLYLINFKDMHKSQQNPTEISTDSKSNSLPSQFSGILYSVPVQKLADYKLQVSQQKPTQAPSVDDFRRTILEDSLLRMYFNDDVLKGLPLHYHKQETFRLLGNNVEEAIELLKKAITTAPLFDNQEIIGLPIIGLFRDYLQTKQGQAFFSDRIVNEKLRAILNAYGNFLDQPESLKSYKTWISPDALKHWQPDQWIVDKQDPNHGFKCWHDFFLRKFKQDKRPIAEGEDIVANICQSTPLANPPMPVRNIQKSDCFWLKDVKYSLTDMVGPKFNHVIDEFVGGTVYQALLLPWNYHRAHSPLDGQILQIQSIPGCYFLKNPNVQEGKYSYRHSQPFLACTATRLIFLIQSKHFGKIFVILIGMAEVSSCVATNPQLPLPRKVKKGEEIGHFQYGGSTFVMIFDSTFEVNMVQPMPDPEKPSTNSFKINVRAPLAQVSLKSKK